MARSPTRKPRASGATSTTSPAHSSPRMGEAPGGGGYMPWRCNRSARFTAVARTRIRRSAGPSAGAAASPSVRTDSSPGSRIRMARMRLSTPWRRGGVNGYTGGAMSIALAGLALALAATAWWLARRLGEVERRLAELRSVRRQLDDTRGDLERALAVTRTHVAEVAAGEAPPRDVIVRGQPYRSIEAAPAMVLYQQQPDLYVLDVRTPAEFNAGHIPRAHSIPIDELEDRLNELPARDRQ